jgi:hypothetical protein
MAIEVRQATLGDYPAIDAFIREAYEDLAPYKAHDRWRWQFVDNPFGKRAPPVWIALSGDRVVGQIAVQRRGLLGFPVDERVDRLATYGTQTRFVSALQPA